jgi:hypothetical protein
LEILKSVVELVFVDVVNFVTLWNGPIRRSPYLTVEKETGSEITSVFVVETPLEHDARVTHRWPALNRCS